MGHGHRHETDGPRHGASCSLFCRPERSCPRTSRAGRPTRFQRRAGGATLPLGGSAVGAQPHLFPEGLALQLPKGSDLVVQYHFHPTGKAETEKSLIGFYFAKKPPERSLARIQLPPDYSLFSGLDIPAGEKDFV